MLFLPSPPQYYIRVPARRTASGDQQLAVVTSGSLVSRLIPARGFLANALQAAQVAATVIQDDAYTLMLLAPPAAPDMCALCCPARAALGPRRRPPLRCETGSQRRHTSRLRDVGNCES